VINTLNGAAMSRLGTQLALMFKQDAPVYFLKVTEILPESPLT
jgi:hypothetical protein